MIKFVYFDIGGVAIKDFSSTNNWIKLIEELGLSKSQVDAFDSFWKLEAKNSSLDFDVEKLLPLISKRFNVKFPPSYSLVKDGFVSRFEKNTSIWPIIEQIRKKAKIGLLTNMYPNLFRAIKQNGLLPPFEWENIVDSSVVMLQKPDSQIFQVAEDLAKVRGKEILFVDNTKVNVEAAKEFGWQVFFYDTEDYERSSKNLGIWIKKNL